MLKRSKPSVVDPVARPVSHLVADPRRGKLLTSLTDPLGRAGLRSGQVILVLILAVAVIYALIALKIVVIPVLIAIILASAGAPVIMWLRNHGRSRTVSTLIVFLGSLLVFGGIITAVVFAVRNQWADLADQAVEGFGQLQDFVTGLNLPIDQSQLDGAQQAVVDYLTSSSFGTSALAGVSVAGELITGLVLALVVLFYFLRDGDTIWNFFLRPFSGERLEKGRRIGHTGVRVLGGYVRGTATVAAVDAIFIGVGLLICGVPLALPLAVVVFITAFIPIVGATAAGILAALVALVANGPVTALIVVGIVVLVNQLEGNFLQPVLMGNSLKLHPLVILLALTIGTVLGGIVGAILSVPITAVGWAVIKILTDTGGTRSAGPAVRERDVPIA
ncbi:AI-2E family transporter [Naasia lichenicola]|uniref:AI-2E family transporter n=1 Tax=Naasia lichenicola TaxID=2565933 RepID=A0A4S4FQV0_9MICO|nr:AI-2E family transporter [Naasia lichenicola]THG32993.1 AI-2E family transporter [Naasia lichenicola]